MTEPGLAQLWTAATYDLLAPAAAGGGGLAVENSR
jgi:hypothetical protein